MQWITQLKRIFVDEYDTFYLGWTTTGIIILVLGGLFVVFSLMIGVAEHVTFRAQEISIEQVRTDVASIGCSAAEDAVGVAITTNRQIQSKLYWAHHWLTGLVIPNGWDYVELIEIPDCP